jgi:hypothetical protein
MKILWLPGRNPKFVTVGYWHWTEPNNKGELLVEVSMLSDWRFNLAVLGHELIEVFYCWIFHKTTEECDRFDDIYEDLYKVGKVSPEVEPGTDPACPYHWGHMAGMVWEWLCIHLTLASWKKYDAECNKIMGI